MFWWVDIVEGAEEGAEGREQLGVVVVVHGVVPETFPKRQSQVACGSSESL